MKTFSENINNYNFKNFIRQAGKFTKKHWKGIAIATCAIIVTLNFQAWFHNTLNAFTNQEMKFYDIEELSTECCESVEEDFTFDSRKIPVINVDIPFTDRLENFTAKYKVKAGYNGKDISMIHIPIINKVIVDVPKTQILSAELVDDSLNIISEKKNIFNDYSVTDSVNSLQTLKHKAEEHAINNGLYEKARSSAESALRDKIKAIYKCSDSDIEFHFHDCQ